MRRGKSAPVVNELLHTPTRFEPSNNACEIIWAATAESVIFRRRLPIMRETFFASL